MFAQIRSGSDGYLSHRRRAAVAMLAPHLNEDALRDALALLDKEFTAPGVPCLIAYVDAIGARYGIEKSECKRLYSEFFRFLNAVDERDLPEDPWQSAEKGTGAVSAGPDSGSDSPTGRENLGAELLQRASDAGAKSTHVVYAMLIRWVHVAVTQRSPEEQSSFWNMADASVEMISALGATRPVLRRGLHVGEVASLGLTLTTEQMSAVVHALYIALCVAIGRTEADAVFDAVVLKVKQLPEASEFPPERLLWTGYVANATY